MQRFGFLRVSPLIIVINLILLSLAGYLLATTFADLTLKEKHVKSIILSAEEGGGADVFEKERASDTPSPFERLIRIRATDSVREGKIAVTQPLPADAVLMQAPVGELPGIVTGLFSSHHRHQDLAIIEFSGQQKSYRPGDQLEEGGTVVRVLPDRVIFELKGFYVAKLIFPQQNSK
ncbi:type II secretion system protein N [Erwinia sp. ErVv1]|uniref:type II secretion system protein N n=1 Tax=Erwinia sp. ErVv1 TaxID=1603299 RepID=UPI000ACD3059|nr:type II secretion system protein N [Erwinia sp. ErVv1]